MKFDKSAGMVIDKQQTSGQNYTMPAPLMFRLFGGTSIYIGEKPLTDLHSRTAEALLIYVACQDRPLSRQFLADFFWDDRTQEQATANLRSILSTLRKKVGDWLVIDRQTVAFRNEHPAWLDIIVFEQEINALSRRLNAMVPLDETTVEQLEAALAFYQGDFLSGFHLTESRGFEEWIVITRERLRRLAVNGLQRLVDYYLAHGRYQDGVSTVERLISADPYNETAQRQRMWLLARSGNPNAAVAGYQAFQKLLADDLNVEPSSATITVYERISRLSFPPPNNLRHLPSSFIGREEEINYLATDLLNPENRLITIVGPGGIGKTTLAAQIGHKISSFQPGCFLDGIWFIPLAPVDSVQFMITAVANTLGVTLKGAVSPSEQLLKYLAERELLLVFDNVEQLLVEGNAILSFISDILNQAPAVKLLVTSRERLNLRTELIYDIEGLTYPTHTDIEIESAVQYSAIALFIERAKRVSRRFDPDTAELRIIIQLCQLLEGMPLGLEMAAAWTRSEKLQNILKKIQNTFSGLSTTWRDVPERHRSLRAVFDHSWQLLTEEEQKGFVNLAVFKGGFTPTAARAVAGVVKPSRFSGKSLLRQNEDGRYDLHTLIQQFTLELLNQDKANLKVVQSKHANYYLTLLGEKEEYFFDGRTEEVLLTFDAEIENIRNAWHWAVDQCHLSLLNKSFMSFYLYFETRGWFEEGKSHFTQAVLALNDVDLQDAANNREFALIYGRLKSRQGWFAYRAGQLDKALEIAKECVTIFRQLDNKKDLAQSLNDLGVLARRQGDYERAHQLLLEALSIRRQIDDKRGVAATLNNLANAVRMLGDYEGARNYLLESLDMPEGQGDLMLMANALNDLGEISRATEDFQTAREYYERSLKIRQQIGILDGIAICSNNLGSVAHTLGDYESAIQYAEKSWELFVETGNKRAAPYPLCVLGRIARDQEAFDQAFTTFRRALRICYDINYLPKSLDILFEMATVYQAKGEPSPAIRLLKVVIDHPKIHFETRKIAQEILEETMESLPEETAETILKQTQLDTVESIMTAVLRGLFPQ